MLHSPIEFRRNAEPARPKRVLMLGNPAGAAPGWLVSLGSEVHVVSELYTALDILNEDPRDWALFVIDADRAGGLERFNLGMNKLSEEVWRVPRVVWGKEIAEQVLPDERKKSVMLKAPLTRSALHQGVSYALRGQIGWQFQNQQMIA